ncbi:hypothetical protein CTAYLR_000326 [Chrysophaeum taylorii]|uniref:Ku domain-containing protein n=1 Tax=Chrysophaeum taylorii TaxID=2483200 RepID=A0AAD7UER2_9STRA|nr:hypothetical protein CTAYLR_000326 [Chrysophaeum taylorii]
MAGKMQPISTNIVIDRMAPEFRALCNGAIEVVKWYLYSAHKDSEVGVYMFGTRETKNMLHEAHGGYEHVYHVAELRHAALGVVDALRGEVPEAITEGGRVGLVDAIFAAKEELSERLRGHRRLLVLTDAGCVVDDENGLRKAAKQIFGDKDPLELSAFVLGELDPSGLAAKAFGAMAAKTAGALEDGLTGEALVAALRVHLGRGAERLKPSRFQNLELRIGAAISISCKKLLLVEKERLPAQQYECISGLREWKKQADEEEEEDVKVPGATLIQRHWVFKELAGGEGLTEEEEAERRRELTMIQDRMIEDADVVKGYKFGNEEMVFVDDQSEAKAVEELSTVRPKPQKNAYATVVRVAPNAILRREDVLGGGATLVVGADDRGRAALAAISRALRAKQSCAIARWHATNKSPKVQLYALCARGDESLLAVAIPFADDRTDADAPRHGLFSAPTARAKQRRANFRDADARHPLAEAADALVEARAIGPRADLRLDAVNPVRERFLDLLLRKAVKLGDEPMMTESNRVVPDARAYATRCEQTVARAFDGPVPRAAVEKAAEWRDLVRDHVRKTRRPEDAADKKRPAAPGRFYATSAGDHERAAPRDRAEVVVATISSTEPVDDFRRFARLARETNDAALAAKARDAMRNRIQSFVERARDDEDPDLYETAALCVLALREDASATGASEAFNAFLDDFVDPQRTSLADLEEAFVNARAPNPLRLPVVPVPMDLDGDPARLPGRVAMQVFPSPSSLREHQPIDDEDDFA